MEREKKIWDMSFKDVCQALLRFWLVIFVVAVLAGGSTFLVSYYNTIVLKDYISNVQFTFIYSVKTLDSGGNESWRLATPTEYINVYKNALSDEEVYSKVAQTLGNYADEDIRYSTRELQAMTQVTQIGSILKVSVTTKNQSHTQKILTQIINVMNESIHGTIEAMKSAEADSAKSSIVMSPDDPMPGALYESEDSLVNVLITTVIVLIIAAVLAGAAIVLLVNFNGRFKRRDVFENNYDIAVLGEIPVTIRKISEEGYILHE